VLLQTGVRNEQPGLW